jgi:hypothetical protein
MKRKAILIESSDVAGETKIPGALVDINNWATFLKSDLGGAWLPSEITILHKPFSGDVTRHLEVERDCYCFVAFSGHGANGSVALNDTFTCLPIDRLRPTSKRGTLVVDACRGVIGETRNFAFGSKMALMNEALERSVVINARQGRSTDFTRLNSLNATPRHRSAWGLSLMSSLDGTVEMLACSEGQDALEDPSSGGYYTSLLLQSAEEWKQRNNTDPIHSTRSAHDYAASLLPPQQKPEYRPDWLSFPFAVDV